MLHTYTPTRVMSCAHSPLRAMVQVRQRVQQHEPLQNTYTARAARSNAVARHESFGSGAAPPFVPWRGWDELESMRYDHPGGTLPPPSPTEYPVNNRTGGQC